MGTRNGIKEPLNSRKRLRVLYNQIKAANAEQRFIDVSKDKSLHLARLEHLQMFLSQGLEYCGGNIQGENESDFVMDISDL